MKTSKAFLNCGIKHDEEYLNEPLIIETEENLKEQRYRFDSFAPVKEETNCQFLIDGKNYFEAVFEAFQKAKKEELRLREQQQKVKEKEELIVHLLYKIRKY